MWSMGLIGLGLGSCSTPTGSDVPKDETTGLHDSTARYFSLEQYFNGEIERLSATNNPVKKSVSINGETDTQTLNIANWNHELELFRSADINKAAWRGSYRTDSTEYGIVYESLEPDLKTRKITIKQDQNGEVTGIKIENQVANWIYRSNETLIYVPDSVYEIIKHQDIRIVGKNEYHIKGFGKP